MYIFIYCSITCIFKKKMTICEHIHVFGWKSTFISSQSLPSITAITVDIVHVSDTCKGCLPLKKFILGEENKHTITTVSILNVLKKMALSHIITTLILK